MQKKKRRDKGKNYFSGSTKRVCINRRRDKMTLPIEEIPEDTGRSRVSENSRIQDHNSRPPENSVSNSRRNEAMKGSPLPNIATIMKKPVQLGSPDKDTGRLSDNEKENIELMDAYSTDSSEILRESKASSEKSVDLFSYQNTDTLYKWRDTHPDNWDSNLVMDWIYSVACDTEEINMEILFGEAFRNLTGQQLSSMKVEDYIARDKRYGEILYNKFHEINVPILSPTECDVFDHPPFLTELICPEDNIEDTDYPYGRTNLQIPDPVLDINCPSATFNTLQNIRDHVYDLPAELPLQTDCFKEDADITANLNALASESKGTSDATFHTATPSLSSLTSMQQTTGSYSAYRNSTSSFSETASVFSGTTYSSSQENNNQMNDLDDPYDFFNSDLLGKIQGHTELPPQQREELQQQQQQQQQLQQQQQQPLRPDHITILQQQDNISYLSNSQNGLYYGSASYTFTSGDRETQTYPVNSYDCNNNSHQNSSGTVNRNAIYVHCNSTTAEPPIAGIPYKEQCQLNNKSKRKPGRASPLRKKTNSTEASGEKTTKKTKKAANKDPNKPKSKRGRKKGQLSKSNHLWRFLLALLQDERYNPEHIKWENRSMGIFTIISSGFIADLWGEKKKNPKMNYEKMSRAIRFCKTPGYIKDVPKKKKVPTATLR